ncbi:histidine phosphatase family protein [Octadecabacter sp. CECT 8868]|uniref:histidine phosphatase family protein n=1 Tax=Octadecabacter algicola TaxID=2909342 RepID=UPI001F465C30|nr:histidine phosphatase family protein [Octadecabacter algicola]MCF2903720.1 histidine phosphatase family protein [Octadecabacter algicola]
MTYPELYILRHGETEWNAENRMQGWLNSPLTAKGQRDAARQGEILRGLDLEGFSFWSSPSGRAFQTAGLACGVLAESIHTDIRLREIGVGEWSGRLRLDLPMPDGPDPELAQYEMAPGGEGFAAVTDRAAAFLADLKGPAVLITHGITSRAIRSIVAREHALANPSIHGGQGCVYHLKDGVQKLLT